MPSLLQFLCPVKGGTSNFSAPCFISHNCFHLVFSSKLGTLNRGSTGKFQGNSDTLKCTQNMCVCAHTHACTYVHLFLEGRSQLWTGSRDRIRLETRLVCRGLGSITMDKKGEDDGILVELFQILKVLHSICQQIWKTQQWPRDWKRSVFIPIPKKDNAKKKLKLLHNCTHLTR